MWAEAIQDGHRPDFFVLFTLSALLEIHTLVHIKDGGMWSTLENPPVSHEELIACCELHLAYMGQGQFIELVERKHLLIMVNQDQDADIKTIQAGTLTFDELETLNYVIYHDLGMAVGSSEVESTKVTKSLQVMPIVKKEVPDPSYTPSEELVNESEKDSMVTCTESGDSVPDTEPRLSKKETRNVSVPDTQGYCIN